MYQYGALKQVKIFTEKKRLNIQPCITIIKDICAFTQIYIYIVYFHKKSQIRIACLTELPPTSKIIMVGCTEFEIA